MRFAILVFVTLGTLATVAAMDLSAPSRTRVPAIELRPAPLPEVTPPVLPTSPVQPKPTAKERQQTRQHDGSTNGSAPQTGTETISGSTDSGSQGGGSQGGGDGSGGGTERPRPGADDDEASSDTVAGPEPEPEGDEGDDPVAPTPQPQPTNPISPGVLTGAAPAPPLPPAPAGVVDEDDDEGDDDDDGGDDGDDG